MNDAKLYIKSNSLQRNDAKNVMEEFGHLFDWKDDGSESLADIGCGSGDVMMEFVYPIMPKKFEKLVGLDVSEQMVRFAREKYETKSISFHKLDISMEIQKSSNKELLGCFDYVTSFYCLHWVQNQRQALQNIYKMLKPKGICLLTFLVSNPIFDIYMELSKTIKYTKYMYDVENYISPYHFEDQPEKLFKKYLEEAGLKEFHVEIKENLFVYEDISHLKYAVKAVNPFTSRMALDLQDSFLNDYVKIVERLNLGRNCDKTNSRSFVTPYKLMVAIANK